ncbi:SlyX family protein [Marinihelvus fidelis]|uniref:SlyX family protein n=1 Tax=Marinihelvus fidelis TaxID=2613842 RepID=A0A5N0TDP7_9GAMM|nr:SlyX family protein [Marinihelvus fidelis]KAA9131419.1 SlyX family protein [Marinihelvus fidelis]
MSLPDLTALTARVEELESQLAFAEATHQQLDDTVARQDREISALKRAVEAMARRLDDLRDSGAGGGSDPADEVPPHY